MSTRRFASRLVVKLLAATVSFATACSGSRDHSAARDAASASAAGANATDAGGRVGSSMRADAGSNDAGSTKDAAVAAGTGGAGVKDAGASGHTAAGASGASGDAGNASTDGSQALGDAGGPHATPGWNLVAIDTDKRTYLDYVEVPASGVWTPETNGWPQLAQWEQQSAYSALRFVEFTPGATLSPAQIIGLLPAVAKAAHSISITDAPYNAKPAPADASSAIQAALDAAAKLAKPGDAWDVLVPAGTFNHSKVLNVGPDVHLRRSPEDSGGILHATDPKQAAVHLAGDRSGALFLVLTTASTVRETSASASGLWVGVDNGTGPVIHDPLVIGTEVDSAASAHFFGFEEEGGLWAFNYAHDGFADTFHHTAGSRFCQLVGNRAQTSASRGDDLYAFVGYQGDGDPVHHCSCIANWGRDGHARGLSAVGAGFIAFEHNDIDRTQWAGIYLAREDSYNTYGSFDIWVRGNSIAHANQNGSHDGLLAFADSPTGSHASASFGDLSNQVRRLTIRDNIFSDTSAGVGNGYGIEIRASVDSGDVSDNILKANNAPQLVLQGANFSSSGNQIMP